MSFDVFVQNARDNQIAEVVARALRVDVKDVIVVSDLELIDEPRIVHVERSLRGGEFRVNISVWYETNTIDVNEREFALSLSKSLNCATLITSAEQDPYLFTYLSPDGTAKDVLVQDSPLDERGEIVVCKEFPEIRQMLQVFSVGLGLSQEEEAEMFHRILQNEATRSRFEKELLIAFSDPATNWMNLLWNDGNEVDDADSEEEARDIAAKLLWKETFPETPLPELNHD